MKKLTIIAAIALLAGVACTKEVVNTTPPQAISFQVANYLPQTKTDLPAPVKFEDYTSFTTSAWFHPADGGSTQVFMVNETVSMDATTGVWAPARSYFWPKTGYINFYSQAGTPVATFTDGTAKYGASPSTFNTIAITDNPVLASAAYHYSRSNWNADNYSFQYGSSNTDVTGVPTLFHHMVAKVSFIVKFDATAGSAKDKWTLAINSATLHYADQGFLEITFTDPNSTGLAWPWNSNEQVGWTAGSHDANLSAPAGTSATTDSQTQAGVDGSTSSISTGTTIFDEISVLPQDLTDTGAKLSLNYTLTHYYDTATSGEPNWVQQIVETVNLTDVVDANSNPALGSIALTSFTSDDLDAWYMNHKYVYTVTIKPDHTITFSPAIVPWVDNNTTGYIYPED